MTLQQLREQTANALYQKRLRDEAAHAAWLSDKIQELDTLCEENAKAGSFEAHMSDASNWSAKQFKDIKLYYKGRGFRIKTYTISWK